MPQSAHLRVREGVRLLFGKSPFDPGHSYRGFPKGGVDVAYVPKIQALSKLPPPHPGILSDLAHRGA